MAATIKPSCVRDLKSRVSIYDVVSRVVALKKAGIEFKGLCPFHNEKTPSFHVNVEKGVYLCRGCGKAGDVVTFVRETERLEFTEAVETLGQRFNIVIEYEEGRGPSVDERSLRKELFDLHEVAAEHYRSAFLAPDATGAFARDYWETERRFPLDVAEEFKIGVAAPADGSLTTAVLRRGFSEDAIRQSGLFYIREGMPLTLGALRPRFRGRLMIPIRDHQSRIVAFTARQLSITPEDDPSRDAKYVNSPETPIFTKGQVLFNLDRARTAVSEHLPFVLVEGQLDAIRCWSCGIKTAVAPQGTAITEAQLSLLRRYTAQVEYLLDGDSAGQKGALRSMPLALRAGLELRFLIQPANHDADSLLEAGGAEAVQALRGTALSAMAFACRCLLPDPGHATPEAKMRGIGWLFELILNAESEVVRSEYLAEISRRISVDVSALHRDFAAFCAKKAARPVPPQPAIATPAQAPKPGPTSSSIERDLLMLALHFPHLGAPLGRFIPAEWIDLQHVAGVMLNRVLSEYEVGNMVTPDLIDEELTETPAEKELIASVIFQTPRIDDPVKIANEALRKLQERALARFIRDIDDQLRASPDSDAVPKLLQRKHTLLRQLRQPPKLELSA